MSTLQVWSPIISYVVLLYLAVYIAVVSLDIQHIVGLREFTSNVSRRITSGIRLPDRHSVDFSKERGTEIRCINDHQ